MVARKGDKGAALPPGMTDAQWKPGQSGNPAGRPKGARSKLGESFLADLLADFEAHGVAAIAAAREADPMAYVRMVASLLPRNVNVSLDPVEELTDAELVDEISRLHALLPVGGPRSVH